MTLKAKPEQLRVPSPKQDRVGVDWDQNAILGYVVAEEGDFKSSGRGRFNAKSIEKLAELGNAAPGGIRNRFQHPGASDDGLGKFLGRAKNFRLDKRDGRVIVRADAFMNPTAMEPGIEGGKGRGRYLMELAESDPGALQSSIVVDAEKIQTDETDDEGNKLNRLWMPRQLFASDFVDEGDAVHGDLFGTDMISKLFDVHDKRVHVELPAVVTDVLDRGFADADRETISTRFQAFLDRYLDGRFGPVVNPKEPDVADNLKETLEPAKPSDEVLAIQETLKAQGDAIQALAAELKADRELKVGEQKKTDRAAEIAALCKQCGSDQAAQFIADENLSVADVQGKLLQQLTAKGLKLGDDNSLQNGGSPKDPVEELRAKYDERAEQLKKAGYSNKEEWVRHQCRDKEIEYRKPGE